MHVIHMHLLASRFSNEAFKNVMSERATLLIFLQVRSGSIARSHTTSSEDLVPEQTHEVEENGKCVTFNSNLNFCNVVRCLAITAPLRVYAHAEAKTRKGSCYCSAVKAVQTEYLKGQRLVEGEAEREDK